MISKHSRMNAYQETDL